MTTSERRVRLQEPPERKVFQRELRPWRRVSTAEDALLVGQSSISISLEYMDELPSSCCIEVIPFQVACGKAVPPTDVSLDPESGWIKCQITVPAGGWYFIRVTSRWSDGTDSKSDLGQFAVGDVYVIAGQSYAGNSSESLLHVRDPLDRTVAYDYRRDAWVVAHDPMPDRTDAALVRGAFRGSVWPPCMNALQPLVGVPIGLVQFIHVAPVAEWAKGAGVYEEFFDILRRLKGFRAILWAHGESDLICGTSAEDYQSAMVALKASLEGDLSTQIQWMMAYSSIHPCVERRNLNDNPIRDAQLNLIRNEGFLRGPDTDCLDEPFRRRKSLGGHFSYAGQRMAGLLWFAAIWAEIYAPQILRFSTEDSD